MMARGRPRHEKSVTLRIAGGILASNPRMKMATPPFRLPCLLALAALAAGLALPLGAQPAPDALADGFQNPPDSAKPRAWWHWTNGNVTKDGIHKDLEWMKRVGIGGMQLADVGAGGGQTVEPKILFGHPEWFDAVRYASEQAERLGLEMSIFSSAGWSETGGPWVKPEQAMKKLVWSETAVAGPQSFHGQLAQPPSNNGPFGNLAGGGRAAIGGAPDPTYYGDSAVVAYRTPADETDTAALHPVATTNAGPVDATVLMDGNLNTSLPIPAPRAAGPPGCSMSFPSRWWRAPSRSSPRAAAFPSAASSPATTARTSGPSWSCRAPTCTARPRSAPMPSPRRLRATSASR